MKQPKYATKATLEQASQGLKNGAPWHLANPFTPPPQQKGVLEVALGDEDGPFLDPQAELSSRGEGAEERKRK